MRLNRYIATHTKLSRRKADDAVAKGSVIVNRKKAHPGLEVDDKDNIIIDGKRLRPQQKEAITILINKPVGYICSKDGQGNPSIYELIPEKHQNLNIAGRLDKDSSGLVILTNDGVLLNELTHPSYNKEKLYEVVLDKKIKLVDLKKLNSGISIGDERVSKLNIKKLPSTQRQKNQKNSYLVIMTEGRNRQIRRTFEALKYRVVSLHRTEIGPYKLGQLRAKQCKLVTHE